MWDRNLQVFPDTPEGQTLSTEFTHDGTKEIIRIEPNCSCTTHTLIGLNLKVLWKIAVKRRERDIRTYLTIVYQDQSIDDLELQTHVITNST